MLIKSLIRLWNYLNIYYLKPFDAVNDTITSDLLLKLNWQNNYIEIGSGDGAFSFIMHGGSFSLYYDRYLNVNLNKKDIFNSNNKNLVIKKKYKKEKIYPSISIDAKKFHVDLVKKIGFSKKTILSKYENLPIKSRTQNLIFFYTPHGLKSHSKSIKEASRILKTGGRILILVYLKNVEKYFICNNLKKISSGFLNKYFSNLDNGRFKEITKMSDSLNGWKKKLSESNLRISKFYTGLHPIAWMIYDIQTRPILKILIRLFNFFPIFPRTMFKIMWMIILYPILIITYILFRNYSTDSKNKNCYIVFETIKK